MQSCWISFAQAHLMPFQNGTLNIEGNSVFAAISIPVTSLYDFDDDNDGLISANELERHQEKLRLEVDKRLMISDGLQKSQTVLIDLIINPLHSGSQDTGALNPKSDQLLVLKHARFERANTVKDLILNIDFFGKHSGEQQITIKATRGLKPTIASEIKVLTPLHHEQKFFSTAIETFFDYLKLGIEHVLTGPDHLIFLLTVIAAGLGLRYWLSVITGFTIAHSISLGLALLGYLQIASYWVELAIALSIVIMALVNLLGQSGSSLKVNVSLGVMVCIVGAFGLVHGLGFASAIQEIGVDSSQQYLSLFGFNLGIEIGQIMFLLMALFVFFMLRYLAPKVSARHISFGISLFALIAGIFWMSQRLI